MGKKTTEAATNWRNRINRKYDEHKHCIVCGRAIPTTQDFCTGDCKTKYQDTEKSKGKKENTKLIFMMVAFGGVFIFMMLANR